MAKKISDNDLVMDGYKALFAAATPSADFEDLVNNCLRYVDSDGNTHFSETPLTMEECMAKGWMKDIEYMNYSLSSKEYERIVEEKIKEHKLKGTRAEAFRTTMYLGSGPNIVD